MAWKAAKSIRTDGARGALGTLTNDLADSAAARGRTNPFRTTIFFFFSFSFLFSRRLSLLFSLLPFLEKKRNETKRNQVQAISILQAALAEAKVNWKAARARAADAAAAAAAAAAATAAASKAAATANATAEAPSSPQGPAAT